MKSPFFSIIIPCYNAEQFLPQAINSIRKQTFADWEAIVVDDASTDKSRAFAQAVAESDSRISVVERSVKSGCPQLARKDGAKMAQGKYVCHIDADDVVEPDYLAKIHRRITQTDAQIVIGTSVVWYEGDSCGPSYPPADYDFSKVCSGRDLVRETLDGWVIGVIGAFEREIYSRITGSYKAACLVHADEIFGRHLLLAAPKVAFTDARYFYRNNPDSITHAANRKAFDFLNSNRELQQLVTDTFGVESEEYALALRQQFHGMVNAMDMIFKLGADSPEGAEARENLDADIAVLKNNPRLHSCTSGKMRAIMFASLPFALRCALMSAYLKLVRAYHKLR